MEKQVACCRGEDTQSARVSKVFLWVTYFAELVAPKAWVVLLPCNPVSVHVLQEVITTKGFEESANIRSVVRWDESTVWQSVCSVGSWDGVVLTGEIAVLRVAAVTKVWPETV